MLYLRRRRGREKEGGEAGAGGSGDDTGGVGEDVGEGVQGLLLRLGVLQC